MTRSFSPSCPDPVRFAVMRQEWRDLAYIHWRYEPSVVQALLPEQLTVDTFDGSAWVGLIPFSMRNIGLPHGPSVPYLGSFPEINVRTYVIRDGRPGVWFFSLDVNRFLPAVVARLTYRLPYCWGRASHEVSDDLWTTRVRRRWPHAVEPNEILLQPGEEIEPDQLDHFLTARWGLYSRSGRGVRYAPVDHEPWPLRAARLERADTSLVTAAGLPEPAGEPHVRCSPGVSVRIGRPRRVH
ncbi:MAG: YqjF family protein [Ilumatobacteraceae bacterium]